MKGRVLPRNEKGLVPIELATGGGGCEGCSAKGICKLPASDLIEVSPEVLPPGVQPGDMVDVELPPSFRVWLSFSVFIVPLLFMLLGAILGSMKGEMWAIGSGFAGLLAGMLLNWVLNRGLSAQKRIHITRC